MSGCEIAVQGALASGHGRTGAWWQSQPQSPDPDLLSCAAFINMQPDSHMGTTAQIPRLLQTGTILSWALRSHQSQTGTAMPFPSKQALRRGGEGHQAVIEPSGARQDGGEGRSSGLGETEGGVRTGTALPRF